MKPKLVAQRCPVFPRSAGAWSPAPKGTNPEHQERWGEHQPAHRHCPGVPLQPLLVPSQPSYLSKSFCFQGFLISKAAVPGGSTGGSQWVAVGQGLPVWEIDAAHAAKRGHPALLRALDPAPVEGDLVGAAGAGCCSRRGVYAGPHPSGGAVGVPPAAAPGDGCTIRPQSHSAKNPA